MVYTLINVLKKIKIDKTVIIYGDIIFSFKDLNRISLSNKNLVTLIDFKWKKLWKKNKKIDYDLETLKISKDKIVKLGKKTNEIKNIDARYIGITKFSKKTIKKIINIKKIDINKIDMTTFLMQLIKQKFTINYLKSNHDWYEFDNKQDLNIFKKKFQTS